MASQAGDRLIWLCLGVTLYFAARGITAELYRIRELTQIKKSSEEESSHVIGEATEDALNLGTLRQLAQSPDYELRASSMTIICERATKGPARDLLLKDLSGLDAVRRDNALTALYFLLMGRPLTRSFTSHRFRDPSTFRSLIDCLCNFLGEHTEETGMISSPILPKTRPLGENRALAILCVLLPDNVLTALEAGLVTRWLAKYPFPCASQTRSKRRNVVFYMRTRPGDDQLMSTIFEILFFHREGGKQLRLCGLMGGIMPADIFNLPSNMERNVWMLDDESTAEPRPREGTVEDQALRRRRREAVVISEGAAPLSGLDIFEPV
ncbi:hypothetical protein LOY89_003429 [Ophidiomyces ophidiicola]|nr:hypothetical protein LOY89_003429 [Ophidiomyces ophidiicola]